MKIQEYLDEMKELYNLLLDYIDDDDDDQVKFTNLKNFFITHKISSDKHQLTAVNHLISSIIDYHYRSNHFYEKIFNFIKLFKEELMKYYSQFEVLYFFKNNKRVLLFLSEENIINLEELSKIKLYDLSYLINHMYYYSFGELRNTFMCLNIQWNINEIKSMEYRDNHLLKLIQKDLIGEFISETSKVVINFEKDWFTSAFETNIFLDKSFEKKLIDYAAFYGSVQIFKYLMAKGCKLNPKLWLFAIHGRNPEIIHILEDRNIQPKDESFLECLGFAIICHHNEIANYILNNYIKDKKIDSYIIKKSLKCYNYAFIQPQMINSNIFFYLCKRDYYFLANYILQNDKNIDINSLHRGKKEKTVLICSIEKGNFEIVQLLLECKDINVNKKSSNTDKEKYESTPLLEAVYNGNQKIIQALLNCKDIDINMKSCIKYQQLTPLNVAIRNDDTETVRLLIERNDIIINQKSILLSDNGFDLISEEATPLYQAV